MNVEAWSSRYSGGNTFRAGFLEEACEGPQSVFPHELLRSWRCLMWLSTRVASHARLWLIIRSLSARAFLRSLDSMTQPIRGLEGSSTDISARPRQTSPWFVKKCSRGWSNVTSRALKMGASQTKSAFKILYINEDILWRNVAATYHGQQPGCSFLLTHHLLRRDHLRLR